ncbi:MAG: hypothetical protein Q8L48_35605 [Archangium sp.]|nr:hypothetical protein [Archangium sp.]
MAQVTAYVTRQEFDIVKAELERLSVAVQVLSDGQLTLTRSVADLAERMEAGFAGVDAHFEAMEARLDSVTSQTGGLKQLIEERHAELLLAVLAVGKR